MVQTSLWKNFQLEITGDSSPTLRLNGVNPKDPTRPAESMHHSGGAASETVYIYGAAAQIVYQQFKHRTATFHELNPSELRTASVGLGLGYNEILMGILAIENPAITSKLDSFEIDQDLKISFLNWIYDREKEISKNKERAEIYDQIFFLLNQKLSTKVEFKTFKDFIQKNIQSGHWRFLDELSLQKIPQNSRYHLCLFDAFSQKTTQELWDHEFLEHFIGRHFDLGFASLATYACTGLLTRTLKSHGFSVQKKPGFQGKRDSTWAQRIH